MHDVDDLVGETGRERRGRVPALGTADNLVDNVGGQPVLVQGVGEVVGELASQASALHARAEHDGQAAKRLSFRICLSKARQGTSRRNVLTRAAVEPAA